MNGLAVPITRCVVEISATDDLALLPEGAAALFAARGAGGGLEGFYATADWYRTLVATALPAGATPCFVLACLDGIPAALFPLLRMGDGALQSLTTPYTCLYQPLVAEGVNAAQLRRIGAALGRFCRRWPSLRIEALDADWPGLAPLCAGLRRARLVPLRFDHFGNWHENVAGLSWAAYLASRDGALRETIRRRAARVARDKRIRIALLRMPAEIAPGITAFEDVYGRSWKIPEPHPHFNAALMRMAADQGVLRLLVMWQDAQPVAVQYWIVTGGAASVLKLAHDEAFRALSPGTVLTAWMIRHLLDEEHVRELDFGRGDDPYKQGWTARRRQRVGLLVVDPRRLSGLALLARHGLGLLRRLIRNGLHGRIMSQ
jgi:CelD/BcsL family acetyltransferase involved in cellulose biosynthesis